jgi:hypothetical protein
MPSLPGVLVPEAESPAGPLPMPSDFPTAEAPLLMLAETSVLT